MAKNSIHIEAPPSSVWAVLDDPSAYPRWVVGAVHTITADPNWPAPGSSFRVKLAHGDDDVTKVREVDPGRRIVLDAAARLYGPARVTVELEPEGDGTRVTMIEDPAGKLVFLRAVPLVHLGLRLRNVEALRRLRKLVLERKRSASRV